MFKSRFKYISISLSLFLIVFASLFVFFISNAKKIPKPLFVFRDIGIPTIPDIFTPEVYREHKVGQTFLANFSNLFRVGLFIENSTEKHGGDLIFHLKESFSAKTDLVKIIISASYIKQNIYDFYRVPPDPISKKGVFYYLQFIPIRDSKDKLFYFYVEAPSCSKDNGYKLGFFNSENYFSCREGNAYIDNRPRKGYLAFQTQCSWEGNILDILNEIKNNLSKDRNFMKLYFSLCSILFLIIIISFISTRKIFK